MFISCPKDWARRLFSKCNLGDLRRTKRLMLVAANFANNVGQSVVQSSSNESEIKGAYRLISNEHINCEDIANSGFNASIEIAKKSENLLALEDTTDVSYCHSVASELGYIGNSLGHKTRGFMVHSIMLLDKDQEKTIGLVAQQRWKRKNEEFGKSAHKKTRLYSDKESYKWESASRAMQDRLGDQMSKVISVCDREADVYEYLHYKVSHSQRFIVRGKENRKLSDGERLLEYIENFKPIGAYQLNIPQKGGRTKRQATMEISHGTTQILPPKGKRKQYSAIDINVVICQESEPKGQKPLKWVLLTTEPTSTEQDIMEVIRCYELRWKIEEFHKAWKSGGTQVESLRMQISDHVERTAVILAFVAVRLLQLKELGEEREADASCTQLLTPLQWKLLWRKLEKRKPPKKIPNMKWAYQKLGRLGGWNDSKRTGRVGWNALWEGWFRLELMVEGYEIMQPS